MSGVQVATMIRSMALGLIPPNSIACRAAAAPMSEVNSSSAATRRSLMPVRSMIHSSEVSRVSDSSALVTTRSGTAVPQPVTRRPLIETHRTTGSFAWGEA